MLSQTKSMYRTQIQQALRAIDFTYIVYHKYGQKSSKISALSQINAGAETNLNEAVKHLTPSTYFAYLTSKTRSVIASFSQLNQPKDDIWEGTDDMQDCVDH